MKVVALISGGKDSCFNMMHCVAMGHKIVALANLQPKVKDELDSYMYQTVGHEGIELYSQAMDLPLYRRFIEGSSHSKQMNYATDALDEVEDLYKLLKQIKGELEFDAVSCGAILSDYQRIRVEHVCQRLDLFCLSYLWRQNQQELMQDMIDMEVEAVIIKVAALGLNQNHLGKTLNEVQQHLLKLNQKYGCHICGEGGEYETFTTDCPLFKRKIVIDKSKVIVHSDDFCGAPVAYLRLESLHLEDKTHNLQALKILSEKYIVNFQDIDFDSISLHSKMTKNSSLRNNSVLSSVNNQKEPVLIKCYEQYCAISNLSGNVVEKSSVDSVQKAAKHVLTQLVELLKENGHTTKDVCYIHLYIGDMSDFIAINNIYKEFFAYNPPARVCIGLPILSEENTNLNTVLTLDCVSCKSDSDIHSKVMHVQGISHWAPANIGPYSQCVQRGDLFFVAGQIGLLPGTMELIEGGCFSQACLSLQHAHSVLQAMKNDLGSGNITQCVCYIKNRSYLNAAQNAEKYVMGAGVILPVLYVVIPQLPKNALVEWQVIASSSQTTIPVCLYTSAMKPNLSLLDTFNNLLYEIKRAVKKDNLDWNQVLQIRLFYVKELVGPPLIAQRGDLEGDFPSICCIPVQAIFGREAKSELSMAAFGLIVAKS